MLILMDKGNQLVIFELSDIVSIEKILKEETNYFQVMVRNKVTGEDVAYEYPVGAGSHTGFAKLSVNTMYSQFMVLLQYRHLVDKYVGETLVINRQLDDINLCIQVEKVLEGVRI